MNIFIGILLAASLEAGVILLSDDWAHGGWHWQGFLGSALVYLVVLVTWLKACRIIKVNLYVDHAIFTKPGGRKKFCHLIAPTVGEMHEAALKLGVGRHFFHSSATYPHYDLSEEHRARAIALGATEVSSQELVTLARVFGLRVR